MSAELASGHVLDGFVLGERLPGGTMARIFRASREGCDVPLVVKLPRLGHGETGASVVSYEVEHQVLSSLQGRHVPRFVAAGALDRVPYIAMEHVDGQSLERWAERAPIDPREVASLGAALAAAVHAIHLQDAIHLDVKPANVLVRASGEMVLLDFGLAHHARYPDLLAEEFSRPIGTAPYISPEQVLGVRNDPRSDLFAIGVVLYQLATGRLPFGAPASPRGLRERLFAAPAPPRAIVSAIPEALQETILRCLEPEAGRRHPTAAHLAFDLANPVAVEITARGRGLRSPGLAARMARWVRGMGYEPAPVARPAVRGSLAPILMVAIGPPDATGERAQALATGVRRELAALPEARLACVTVMRAIPDWGTDDPRQTAAREHLRQRVALQQWAAQAQLPLERVTFHVLESPDPGAALLEYIRANAVEQLVIGEPQPWTPSIGGRLAAEAPCTVTIVRQRI